MKRRVSDATPNDINLAMEINEKGLVRTSAPIRVIAVKGKFDVAHTLGSMPDGFDFMRYGDVNVWATEDDRNAWTNKTLTLTGSAAVEVDVWATMRL